jgi:hypothetical protein
VVAEEGIPRQEFCLAPGQIGQGTNDEQSWSGLGEGVQAPLDGAGEGLYSGRPAADEASDQGRSLLEGTGHRHRTGRGPRALSLA